jgi:hypothetical protein
MTDRDERKILSWFGCTAVAMVGFVILAIFLTKEGPVCENKTIIKIGGCTAHGCGVKYEDGTTGAELFPIEGRIARVCLTKEK